MAKSNISTTGLSLALLALGGFGMFGQIERAYAQSANPSDNFGVQDTSLVFGQNNNDDFLVDPLDPNADQQAQDGDGAAAGTGINNPIQNTNIQLRAARATAAGGIVNPNDLNGGTRANIPASPTQTGTGQVQAPAPFAPEGFRLGSFDGNVSLEQAIGYSDNVSDLVGGDPGGFTDTNFALSLTSDFSRHQIQTNLNANYERPFDETQVDTLQVLANTSLRLDLADGHTLTTALGYNLQTLSFTNSALTTGAVDTPNQETYSVSVELAQDEQKLQYNLRGSLDRSEEDDVDLGGGLFQSQEDQSQNLYQFTARLGYEVSPAITPFVEGTYGIREFDLQFDRNGNERDSNIFQLRSGLEIDLGEKFSGEISAGFVSEDFEDEALETLDGFTVDAVLNWSPVRDTQYILTLGTATNDSVALNDNGSLIYNARLDYQKQITSRFAVNAFADYQIETNDDSNQVITVGAGTEYFLNRHTAITTDIEFTEFTSDIGVADFTETSATIGILLQK